jgi:crotonobetainyl-CoA:carnitine CoA-transferase CaiB-like acyl-CoA transferase
MTEWLSSRSRVAGFAGPSRPPEPEHDHPEDTEDPDDTEQPMTAPLSGTVVVDLSSGIAGAYATKLLADGGADVVKVEPPEGDPLRRWSASGAELPDGTDGALFSFLSSSKQSVVADPDRASDLDRVRSLLAGADAVVWSRGSRLAEASTLAPDAIAATAPLATVTTITPFGLDGPWVDRPATEFTVQALSGGIIGLGRGNPDRAPVFVGGQIGEWLTGVQAAIGTLASRARARLDGVGELVDVSMLETLAMCLTYEPVTYVDLVGRPFRTGRAIVTPGVETTRDGVVGLGVGTGQQWLDFCVMVEHPEWMEDRSLFANRVHLRPDIAAWMAERTTDEVLELAAAFRIPHAPLGNGASIPETDHFQARGSVVTSPRGDFAQPAPPYRFDPPLLRAPEPAPARGDHRDPLPRRDPGTDPGTDGGADPGTDASRDGASGGRASAAAEISETGETSETSETGETGGSRPYEGLRVLDMTAFWAGPVCTHGLALLGAEVLHLESTARPDGTRLLAGLRFSEPNWWERSGIFCGLNSDKLGVTLDLATDEGRDVLRQVIATCDVVVENNTPRVMEQLGFDVDAIRAIRPDIIVVRMPGFGLDGPWRDDPAFAFVIEDAAGLTWLTGFPDANPISPYCVGDSNAGTHALCGLLLALEHRRRTGEGVVVEASMVDAALNVAAEQVVEHSAYGALLGRDGNRGPTAAPQNLYLAADTDDGDGGGGRDTWVAVAVATDDQWRSLVDAIGRPGWATDPALDTAAGRRLHHDAVDEHLAAWCATRTADEIVETLWSAGVPVGQVVQPHEQADLEQLRFRGFFEEIDREASGPARYRTLPFRFSRGPERIHRSPAPLLGEHTDEVLAQLGLDAAARAGLAERGVTGRVPDADKSTRA